MLTYLMKLGHYRLFWLLLLRKGGINMANIMTKRGTQDNVITYEEFKENSSKVIANGMKKIIVIQLPIWIILILNISLLAPYVL